MMLLQCIAIEKMAASLEGIRSHDPEVVGLTPTVRHQKEVKVNRGQRHVQAIESYINGNISEFKKYIHGLTRVELLKCTQLFVDDYKYSVQKMIWLMEG